MLVVRRRAGESIVVAGDVEISVVEISRTRVKLGITAPRNVSIARRESLAAAVDNKAAAALISARGLHSDLIRLLGGLTQRISKSEGDPADM